MRVTQLIKKNRAYIHTSLIQLGRKQPLAVSLVALLKKKENAIRKLVISMLE